MNRTLRNKINENKINDTTPIPAPTNVVVAGTGPQTISLTWDAVTDPNNPSNGQVLNYIVGYYPTANSDLVDSSTTPNYLPQITLSGLLPATEYTIVVVAVSIVGAGSQSDPSTPITDTTSAPLPINSWDIPAAICADPTTLALSDVTDYLANILGLKKIFLYYTDDSNLLTPLANYVGAIQGALGGSVILSFGKIEPLIETTTSDVATIVAFYQSKITSFNLEHINFVLGIDFLSQNNPVQNHIAAIIQILQNNPTLKLAYTLPVDAMEFDGIAATGLDSTTGVSFLTNLFASGVIPSLINARATDDYPTLPDNDLLQTIKASIESTASGGQYDVGLKAQLKSIYGLTTDAQAYSMIGVCPVFGQNLNGAVFSVINETGLIASATLNGMGNLNGEDVTTDMNLLPAIGLPFAFSQLLSGFIGLATNETDVLLEGVDDLEIHDL
jgi:Fibronectin type III domain